MLIRHESAVSSVSHVCFSLVHGIAMDSLGIPAFSLYCYLY